MHMSTTMYYQLSREEQEKTIEYTPRAMLYKTNVLDFHDDVLRGIFVALKQYTKRWTTEEVLRYLLDEGFKAADLAQIAEDVPHLPSKTRQYLRDLKAATKKRDRIRKAERELAEAWGQR